MENLDEIKKQAEDNIKEVAIKSANETAEKVIKAEVDNFKEELKKAATVEAVEKLSKETNDKISRMQADLKSVRQTSLAPVSFKSSQEAMIASFEKSFDENKEMIKGYQGGSLQLPVTKAITQASFGVGGYADLTGQNLGLDINPYSPVYLRNIFPNVTTGGSNVTIWKRGAVTGKAAIWKRGTGDAGATVSKPEVNGSWVKEVVSVDWIAAHTIIDREVLDDVDFMRTEIPQLLIYGESGILRAENKMILDYIADNAVDYTLPTDFDGFDNSLESILAAAFGQMGDRFLTPTHILISNWDYLKYLAFNKATGSGQYTYPNMTLTFINNRPYINGLMAVPNADIAIGEAYVVAAARSRFVSREGIRQRISDSHAEIFTTNQVAYLAESRGAFFTYDDNSFVKVALPTPGATGGV